MAAEGPGASRRSRRPRAIAFVLATLVALGAADLGLRAVLGDRLCNRPDDWMLERRPELPLLYRYHPGGEFHRESGGDLSAMLGDPRTRVPRRVDFSVDARGFRNPEGARLEGATLLLLGDSFTVGSGTTLDRTWAGLLARDRSRSIYNLAVPGTPWQEYVTLAWELKRAAPRAGAVMVWEIFAANDLDDTAWGDSVDLDRLPWRGRLGALEVETESFLRRSPLLRLARGALRRGTPGELVVERNFLDGRPMLFFAPYADGTRRSAAEVRRHERFAMLGETVAAARKLAVERGLKLRIVLVPAKEEVYRWVYDGQAPWSTPPEPAGFSAAFREMAGASGVEILDLGPPFIRLSREAWERDHELLYWPDDTHWSERGHVEAAALIERELLRD